MKICKIKDNTGKAYLENFIIWKDEFDNSEIFLFLIRIIMNFFYRLFYIFIIKNLTAIHIIFSNLFYSSTLGWIGNYVKNDSNKNGLLGVFNLTI